MSQEQDNEARQRELFSEALRYESQLHWQRNSYFLVVVSIFLLAFSQFHNQSFQILVSLFGFVLSFVWLLIVYRSDKYIEYWKSNIREIEKRLKFTSIYPETLSGIEIRKLAYALLWHS